LKQNNHEVRTGLAWFAEGGLTARQLHLCWKFTERFRTLKRIHAERCYDE